jgi:hypothetical protein
MQIHGRLMHLGGFFLRASTARRMLSRSAPIPGNDEGPGNGDF